MFTYKLIAVLVAYGALWQALGRWRVRALERRLQLQIYGGITFVYVALLCITGGESPALVGVSLSPILTGLFSQEIRGFFAAFAGFFLLLGLLEMGVAAGINDPSLPLLRRWWTRALFEGPVWTLISRRQPGTPLNLEEGDAYWRHALAGLATVGGALWALQIAMGLIGWGRIDPVAALIALKALNIWLDARSRPRSGAPAAQRPRQRMTLTATGCGGAALLPCVPAADDHRDLVPW
jgi:hypothetical protein